MNTDCEIRNKHDDDEATQEMKFPIELYRGLFHMPNAKLTYSLPGGKRKLESVAAKARQVRKQPP